MEKIQASLKTIPQEIETALERYNPSCDYSKILTKIIEMEATTQ